MKTSSLPFLEIQPILWIIRRFARAKKIRLYLVGGILRDLLLRRVKRHPDFDFCLKDGAISFGRALAKKIKAGFVVLDKRHGACRLVKEVKGKIFTFDFTDFRGRTLEEDLLHRDFSINTLALPLADLSGLKNPGEFIIDRWGGKEDLELRLIRAVNKECFSEDPLRILRAFSFACILNYKIEPKTLRLIRLNRHKLKQVSSERIRDELFKILEQPDSYEYLKQLDELRILEIIFPEIEAMRGIGQGPYHHLDVWQHTLETLRQLEVLCGGSECSQEIRDYLNKVISLPRRRRALMKLGAFLHDIGKPASLRRKDGKTTFHGHERVGSAITADIAKRLKLSNDELECLRKIVLWHLRPGYLADNQEVTPRARFRYFRDTGQEAISTLLISIADQRATKGRLTSSSSRRAQEKVAFSLIKEYFKKSKEKKMPRLINGNDIMEQFKIGPSPLIGRIIREIDELVAIGKIKNRIQALKVAGRTIKKENRG